MAIGWLLFFFYRKLVGARMAQAFRDAGPESHKLKGRVPTGAGIVFVIAALGISAWTWFVLSDGVMTAVFCAAAMMGLIGFIDDRAKVTGGAAGLKARFKFPAMLLVGALLLYVIRSQLLHQTMQLFENAFFYSEPWYMKLTLPLFYLIGLFIWLGAINGSNFTDGLDGLLGSTSFPILIVIILPFGLTTVDLPIAVFMGVLLAYLFFNWKPASIYMGDSGSLCIGALVAGLFLANGMWLFLGLCAFIWVVEVLSVMVQVAYFRRTGGKRIFLMTPIHHHFELAGWKETTIVFTFAALQAWGCLSAWLWLDPMMTLWNYGQVAGLASGMLLIATFVFLVLRYRKRVA